MEEKELTDEEIVKALNKTKQELANISPEDDDYDKLLTVKTIVDYCHDLIHRLQGKIGEYERKLEDGELVSKEWHDEQVLHLEEQCQQFLYDFEQQKSEIERLTSTVNRLEFADKCGRKMRALDIKENAELQKKVDELTIVNANLIKRINMTVKDTAKEIITSVKDSMRHFEDDEDGYLLKKCEFDFFMREIAKSKGVEVAE